MATVALLAPVGASTIAPLSGSADPVASPSLVIQRYVAKNGPDVDQLSAIHWQPKPLTAAYGLTWAKTLGAGKTIAIVDAYNSPHVEGDLGVFDSHYALPACTYANGCLKKVNQNGATSPIPANNGGWSMEINTDVQWAHAVAPAAHILLVEANSTSFADLGAAVHYANQVSNAQYISNSWGGQEVSNEASRYGATFTPKSGKTIFVAAGDTGLPAEYPSADPHVISVGGTTLTKNGSSITETVWSGGGGGCSAYETANSAQANFSEYAQAGCAGKRATPDVAAIADPQTGVLIYTSYPGLTGWYQVGGTSVASPVVAALAADHNFSLPWSSLYGSKYAWRDANAPISNVTNGATCHTGYDLCTGRGALLGLAP